MSGTFHKVSMSTTFQNIEGAEDGETMNLKGEMRGSQSSGPVLSWDRGSQLRPQGGQGSQLLCRKSVPPRWYLPETPSKLHAGPTGPFPSLLLLLPVATLPWPPPLPGYII